VGTVSNPLTWLRQRFGTTRRATSQRATASNQALDEQMLDLREQLGATVDGIVQANATTGTPWAPHLLAAHGQGVDPHWMTVEEWVGDTERITADGIAVREGGVLVLRVCAWPRVDENGRLRLVGEAWAVRVRAAAFQILVRELIGVQARPPSVGSVYLAGWSRTEDTDTPLDTAELFAAVSHRLVDITTEAWQTIRTLSPPTEVVPDQRPEE
jgi:hypothetical protein